MRRGQGIAIVVAAGLLGGCAGKGRQDMGRLQSQLGMLDQRVTQLERSSIGGISSDLASPSMASSPLSPSVEPIKSFDTSGAGTLSLKPSTKAIQQALKNAGFYQGPLDGKMGPQTREAVRQFQRTHGLSEDGVAGRKTWAKLSTYADLAGGGEAGPSDLLK